MLVLTRKVGEEIRIGETITLVVTKLDGGRVSLGIAAPREIPIWRGPAVEVRDRGEEKDNA